MDPHTRLARLARIELALQAARRVASRTDPFGIEARARLTESSRLSPAGIELALAEHLECFPAEEHVARLEQQAGRAPRCHVLLASNVCTAPLRAVVWALATAPLVRLRPSRRDPVLAELLARALAQDPAFAAAGAELMLCEVLEPEAGDALHLYGSDETLSALRSRAPKGVSVQAHGTGLGIAVLDHDAELAAAANGVALDLVPFDGRGCLSPRVVLVDGDAARVHRVARELHESLLALGARIPRGWLEPSEEQELSSFRTVAAALGPVLESKDHVVAVDTEPRVLLLPPAHRCVLVAACTPSSVPWLLGPLGAHVSAIGHSSPEALGPLSLAISQAAPWARHSALGQMQKPPLDGPVDLRPLWSG